MLSARRKSDNQSIIANSVRRSEGPFLCPECGEEVVLRTGSVRDSHFAHRATSTCGYGKGESDEHRRCKLEIFEALSKTPGVTDAALERSFGTNRPDVFARINGVPVAIEVQISTLTLETIIRRTEEYARKGIYVLWLLQWTPYLDGVRYSPRLWEKWIHAAYFGRVYYWIEGLKVASYHFAPHFKHVPKTCWHSKDDKKMTAGGYARRSKRHRTAVRGANLHLARDFVPKDRESWKGNDFTIPTAMLFME